MTDPKPKVGETKAEYHARLSVHVREVDTYAKETLEIISAAETISGWRFRKLLKLNAEVRQRNTLAFKMIAITEQMQQTYVEYSWPVEPMALA